MHNNAPTPKPLHVKRTSSAKPSGQRILLVRPPYFTPWTPPLGIAILKAFLNERGHHARCFDFNADPELWGVHHRYFSTLESAGATTHDGYSKLWWIMNAHMLAYANGASPAEQRRVIESISPLYNVPVTRAALDGLLGLVERYFTRLSHVFDELDLDGYDVIGTSTYTTSLSSSLWVLQRAKRKAPRIKTVMGGGAFADDLALGSENLQILLDRYPLVDHVVLGEGELLLQSLLDGDLAHQRVLSLQDLAGRTLAMTDIPTPDFSDFDMARYYNITIEGARSCPFQCSFCSETIQWGEYRKKPIDKFVAQIREMADASGVREVFMGDSLMNPYLNPFADALIAQQTNIVYDGYLRADRPVTNQKFVRRWAESGLYRVRLGIETASDRVLQSMHKQTTAAVISEVLKTLSRAGIRTTTYWICGYPGETEQEFEETCDFIRAHHPYIYELEAHPYYYYPYGQVGSRLYQCEPAYSEEVTSATRFKVWEIVGGDPPREVRYQRLDRIAQLASDLGLPNIYTMTDRYAAEARWRALHPAAREIFRDADAVAQESPRAVRDADPAGPAESEAVACQLSVATPIDVDVLRRAATAIAGHYPALSGAVEVTQYEVEGAYDDDAGLAVALPLGERLSSSGAAALRIGVSIRRTGDGGGSTRILLVAGRDVADAASVRLMAEALCRTYEQMSTGAQTYLRPEEQAYGEYRRTHRIVPSAADPSDAVLQQPLLPAAPIRLDERAASAISVAAGRRRDAETRLLTALLRILRASGIDDVAVRLDPRTVEPSLAYTAGPVSRIVKWPAAAVVHGDDLPAALETVRAEMRKLATADHSQAPRRAQALIDLDHLAAAPWMGAADWRADGTEPIQAATAAPATASALVVRPRVMPDGIALELEHDGTPVSTGAAAAIARRIDDEIAALAAESEAVRRAERFWREELGAVDDGLGAESVVDGAGAFERAIVDLPAADGDVRAALVACFALLAPRLENRAVPRVAVLHARHGALHPAPLRIYDSGNPTGAALIRAASEKLALAREYGWRASSLAAGLAGARIASQACLMDPSPVRLDEIDSRLLLDLSGSGTPTLWYRPGAYSRADIETLAGLSSVVTRILLDPALRVSDVLWASVEPAELSTPIDVGDLSREFQ